MNVELRPLVPADAEKAMHWRNDPMVWTYTTAAGRGPVDVETERAWIERVMADPTNRRRAILADGSYVGNVYLTDIHDGTAQFHIFIGDRRVWGRGVGRRATAATLELAWRELGLGSVYLLVHRDNAAALSLYRGLGFRPVASEGSFERMIIGNPRQPSSGTTA